MKNRLLLIIISVLAITVCLSIYSSAEDGEMFSYTVTDGFVTITGLNWDNISDKHITEIVVPEEIEGCPVTQLSNGAFSEYAYNFNNTSLSASLRTVILPDSLLKIGNYAFCGCKVLEKVVIGKSLKTIGEYAFYGCKNLKSLVLPDSLSKIESSAFSGCGLESIVLPDSVKIIGSSLFSNCEDLASVSLSKSLTAIPEYTFSGCKKLIGIDIPASVSVIDNYNYSYDECSSFAGCTALRTITVDPDNEWYTAINNCLINKTTKTLILGCKNSAIPDDGSVEIIGYGAFKSRYIADLLIIPKTIKQINSYAFSGCAGLSNIVIPESVSTINEYAFSDCTNLVGATIYNPSINIYYRAFSGCDVLTLYGAKGSSVQQYANQKNIPFEEIAAFITGDANGDCEINAKDVVRMKRYFSEYDFTNSYSSIVLNDGADMNGDGKITALDLLRLKKLIAGKNNT